MGLTNKKKARLFFKGIESVGTVKSMQITLKLMRAIQSRKEVVIQIPGHKVPVYVRGDASDHAQSDVADTSDIETFEKIFFSKEYDCFLEDACFIVDLGANVGFASRFFAEKYPNSKIIAIEPEPTNFAQLCRNMDPNNYPNFAPVEAAIWHRNGELKIINADGDKWEITVSEIESNGSPESSSLKAVTMPEILEMNPGQRINILKIDIESAEKELFTHDYKAWLSMVDVIIIELHDRMRTGCTRAFYQALSNYEYNQYIIGENTFIVFDHGQEDQHLESTREVAIV